MQTPTDAARPARVRGSPIVTLILWGGLAGLLSTPAVAMWRGWEGWDWNGTDFLIMGALMAVVGGGYEWVSRVSADWTYRLALGVAIGGLFLLTWGNMAVGLIGPDGHPINMVVMLVPLSAVVGMILVRFGARGMAWVMAATAGLLVAIVGGAWLIGAGEAPPVTVAFVALWLASAFLFRKAAERGA